MDKAPAIQQIDYARSNELKIMASEIYNDAANYIDLSFKNKFSLRWFTYVCRGSELKQLLKELEALELKEKNKNGR